MRLVLHLFLFQLGWFACVLGAASSYPLAGPMVVLVLVLVQPWLLPVPNEARRIVTALLLGGVVDSALSASGLVLYAQNPAPWWLAPPWIVAMWVNFALTVPRSLAWLGSRPALAALLGAVGGPLAYVAGEALGAVHLAGTPATLALGTLWGLTVPVLTKCLK